MTTGSVYFRNNSNNYYERENTTAVYSLGHDQLTITAKQKGDFIQSKTSTTTTFAAFYLNFNHNAH